MQKEMSEDYIVGKISALSMYITILFLLMQPLFMIPAGIIEILTSKGIIPESTQAIASLVTFLLFESIVIWRITIHIKKKYLPFDLFGMNKEGEVELFIFNEGYLERAFNIAAIIGVLWMMLLSKSAASVKYMLIVVQGFGILFFIIFLVVRLLLTRKIANRTILSILLSVVSIWFAVQ